MVQLLDPMVLIVENNFLNILLLDDIFLQLKKDGNDNSLGCLFYKWLDIDFNELTDIFVKTLLLHKINLKMFSSIYL